MSTETALQLELGETTGCSFRVARGNLSTAQKDGLKQSLDLARLVATDWISNAREGRYETGLLAWMNFFVPRSSVDPLQSLSEEDRDQMRALVAEAMVVELEKEGLNEAFMTGSLRKFAKILRTDGSKPSTDGEEHQESKVASKTPGPASQND